MSESHVYISFPIKAHPIMRREPRVARVRADQFSDLPPRGGKCDANGFVEQSMEHLLVLLVENGHLLLKQLLLFSLVQGLGQTPAVVTVQLLASLAPRRIRITHLNRNTKRVVHRTHIL